MMLQKRVLMGGESHRTGLCFYLEGIPSGLTVKTATMIGAPFTIDWGDGIVNTYASGTYNDHTYTEGGDFVVCVTGDFTQIYTYSSFNPWMKSDSSDGFPYLKRIEEHGLVNLYDNYNATFTGYSNLTEVFSENIKLIKNYFASSNVGVKVIAPNAQLGYGSVFRRGVKSVILDSATSITSAICIDNTTLEAFEAKNCELTNVNYPFLRCCKLSKATFKSVVEFNSRTFEYAGIEANPDEHGIRLTITFLESTMNQVKSSANFPGKASTQSTKFVCSDGYMIYENGAWTNHPY